MLTNATLEAIPVNITAITRTVTTFAHVDQATHCHQTGKSAKVRLQERFVFLYSMLTD